jgi:adenylate cyclase
MVVRKVEESRGLVDRALELDPNDAFAWSWSGWVRLWMDQLQGAIEHFEKALRLSPLDPQIMFTYTGLASAEALLGRYV